MFCLHTYVCNGLPYGKRKLRLGQFCRQECSLQLLLQLSGLDYFRLGQGGTVDSKNAFLEIGGNRKYPRFLQNCCSKL